MENDITQEKTHLATLLSAISAENLRHEAEMRDLQAALAACQARIAELEG